MRRGEVYAHAKFTHRHYLVISNDALNATSGVAVVAEIRASAPSDIRQLVAVAVGAPGDCVAEGIVRGDRINYLAADYLGDCVGRLSDATLGMVDVALRVALDLD